LALRHIEFACSLPRGILTSFERQLGLDRVVDITGQPNPRKWTSRWFGYLFG